MHGPSLVWAEFVWADVCVGRLCYGSTLRLAEFAMGRDASVPSLLAFCLLFLAHH